MVLLYIYAMSFEPALAGWQNTVLTWQPPDKYNFLERAFGEQVRTSSNFTFPIYHMCGMHDWEYQRLQYVVHKSLLVFEWSCQEVVEWQVSWLQILNPESLTHLLSRVILQVPFDHKFAYTSSLKNQSAAWLGKVFKNGLKNHMSPYDGMIGI